MPFDHLGVVPGGKGPSGHGGPGLLASLGGSVHAKPWPRSTIQPYGHGKDGSSGGTEELRLRWRDDVMGRTVREDDRIELGGLVCPDLETRAIRPARSPLRAEGGMPLFASTEGHSLQGLFDPLGNSGFTKFEESWKKWTAPRGMLCADHYGFITGEEAGRFVARTREAAKICAGPWKTPWNSTAAWRRPTGPDPDLYRLHRTISCRRRLPRGSSAR
jgi:hypothetical protein